MMIQTQSVRFDADSKLLEFIEKKVVKLEQFFDHIIYADVILRLEKTARVQDKIAEIKVNVPGSVLVAKENSKTFEESVDTAIDALRRQLIRHKQKMRAN